MIREMRRPLLHRGPASTPTRCAARAATRPAAVGIVAATLVLLVLLALSAGACGSSDESDEAQPWLPGSATGSGTGQPATGDTAVDASGGSVDPGASEQPEEAGRIGDQGLWPAYVPRDIPALDISIRKVMEESTSLRIFYQDLSDEHFQEYLGLLEDAGFELTYVVYQDERYPDEEAAQKRIDAGDFDAVNIEKSDYYLDITYGGGDTVLDIQTLGFEDVYPYTPERDWPADLIGVVPEPEACRMEAVYAQDAGGYQIVCTPESPEVVDAYVQALLAAGFAPVRTATPSEVDVASLYTDVYGKGDLELTVGYPPSISTMRITVWRVDPSGGPAWPSDLEGLVPQPEGATLTMVNDWGDREYQIVCGGSGDMVAAYLAQLVAAGFTDLGRTKMEGSEMISAVAYNDPFTVELDLGVGDELMVRITDEAITYTD